MRSQMCQQRTPLVALGLAVALAASSSVRAQFPTGTGVRPGISSVGGVGGFGRAGGISSIGRAGVAAANNGGFSSFGTAVPGGGFSYGQGGTAYAVAPSNPLAASFANPLTLGQPGSAAARTVFGAPAFTSSFPNVGTTAQGLIVSPFGTFNGLGFVSNPSVLSLNGLANVNGLGQTAAAGTNDVNGVLARTAQGAVSPTGLAGIGGVGGGVGGVGLTTAPTPFATTGLSGGVGFPTSQLPLVNVLAAPGRAPTTTQGAAIVPNRAAATRPNSTVTTPLQREVMGVIANSSRLPSNATIRVGMDRGTIVLHGSVASDYERRLAEAIVRLSPGVREVRNELVVPGE